MSRRESVLRLPRALVFGAVCIAVSAGGHVFAGGGPIPAPLLFAGVLGVTALAYVLSGRERGPGEILAATVCSQVALHQIFGAGAPVPAEAGFGGHAHSGIGMVLIHLVVALLTGWWVYRGESALWLMIRLCGVRIPLVRLLVMLTGEVLTPPRRAVPAFDVHPCGGLMVAEGVTRRGPPSPILAG
ncbi:hypothetical protein Skr01_47520 [Sphaerisporangium krabiense]|uniref:Uncharacterized protein n=1 Tax=Sphaerisporangium krabiense TaxID=763782 RepID=A0A7W8Z1S8_9ACTN|nr:MFS transporter [Sphaerisporangium krabiense]MBB5625864.1 hypothetical protein [Sphaerisporangium krabiense]GII64667.1 hypothetical protein Skr01_47520 [Sphaerisporangium krabiense]